MEITDAQLLQAIIQTWIAKNTKLVMNAQQIAQKIIQAGLLDEKTLPFQIFPTHILDSDGDTMCRVFVFMDHPIYGFFQIELEKDRAIITCPNMYHIDTFTTDIPELNFWIDKLDEEMNSFYLMSENLDNMEFLNLEINGMLANYNTLVKENVDEIKKYIEERPRTAIFSSGFYALANQAVKDFSRALLMPHSWIVFESLDNLPDMEDPEDVDLDSYINAEETEELFQKLVAFNKTQNYLAAPIFLAQRICIQGGLKVTGYNKTEDAWISAGAGENGEFVLPPIDIEAFKIEKGG